MMTIHDRNQECHSERSEESARRPQRILRCAQNDSLDGPLKCERVLHYQQGTK